MATYVKKKCGWTVRIRLSGRPEVTEGGFRTKQEAKDWAVERESAMRQSPRMKGLGPHHTTLAEALTDYVKAVTCKQKGCPQVLTKVNKYRVAAGLLPLKAVKKTGGRVFGKDADGKPAAEQQKVENVLFDIVEEEPTELFKAARQKAFAARKQRIEEQGRASQKHRTLMANMKVADISPHNFEDLFNLMTKDGYAANTQRQEVAILSGMFSHAMRVWKWRLEENPALAIDWPTGAGRERVMSADESMRIAAEMAKLRNKKFKSFVVFSIETAMRKGESTTTACWCDVDWERRVLNLPDSKGGKRPVPLSPVAIEVLQEMGPGEPTEKIFGLTDGQVNSAWKRLCADAKVTNLTIHDLRHTSATFYAKLFHGDIFMLQLVTGHKSLGMLKRYVNRQVDEVVDVMGSMSAPSLGHRMKMAADTSGEDGKTESQPGHSALKPQFEVINLMAAKARRARLQHDDAEPEQEQKVAES